MTPPVGPMSDQVSAVAFATKLPYGSRLTEYSVRNEPAVTACADTAAPVPSAVVSSPSWLGGAALTVTVADAASAPAETSIDRTPAVLSTTPSVKVWVPASPAANVRSAGTMPCGSEVANWTVPAKSAFTTSAASLAATVAVIGAPAVALAGAVTWRCVTGPYALNPLSVVTTDVAGPVLVPTRATTVFVAPAVPVTTAPVYFVSTRLVAPVEMDPELKDPVVANIVPESDDTATVGVRAEVPRLNPHTRTVRVAADGRGLVRRRARVVGVRGGGVDHDDAVHLERPHVGVEVTCGHRGDVLSSRPVEHVRRVRVDEPRVRNRVLVVGPDVEDHMEGRRRPGGDVVRRTGRTLEPATVDDEAPRRLRGSGPPRGRGAAGRGLEELAVRPPDQG